MGEGRPSPLNLFNMGLLIRQGEDKAFSIKIWEDKTKTTLVNLDNLSDIIAIVYTDGGSVAQFSKSTQNGYKSLTRVSSTEYSAILESEQTSVMTPGVIYIGIKARTVDSTLSDGKFDIIREAVIGEVKRTEIKNY